MKDTLIAQCFARAEQQTGIASATLKGLHKIQSMVIAAKRDCRSVNDFELALYHINNTINDTLIKVDEVIGVADEKPEIDHTDLMQDVVGTGGLS